MGFVLSARKADAVSYRSNRLRIATEILVGGLASANVGRSRAEDYRNEQCRSGPFSGVAMIEAGLKGWAAVCELLDAERPLTALAEADARGLLNLSSKALAPLEDPLSTDFRQHRWLKFNREEAYSDWFAWILDELSSVRLISEILGISAPAGSGDDGVFVVEREKPISHGHEGREGRLDILLTRTGACLAIVEIKVTAGDDSDFVKNRGYRQWLDLQVQFPCRKAVMVSKSGLVPDYEGFSHRGWDEVCIALRRLVPGLITEGRCLLAALILCFAGAVEENVLRLETIAGRRDRSPSRAGCIATSAYLARAMNVTVQRDSNLESTRMEGRFMDAGLRCYPQAMFALRDFRRLVLDSSKRVLRTKLPALGTAIGNSLSPDAISDHVNPNDLGQSDGRWGWIAARLALPGIGTDSFGYFGVFWGGDDVIEPEDVRVIAMVRLRNRKVCDGFMSDAEAAGSAESIRRAPENELSLTADLRSVENTFGSENGGPSVFETRLSDLIDQWTHILSRVKARTRTEG